MTLSPIISPDIIINVKLFGIIYKPIISVVNDKQILSLIRLSSFKIFDTNNLTP